MQEWELRLKLCTSLPPITQICLLTQRELKVAPFLSQSKSAVLFLKLLCRSDRLTLSTAHTRWGCVFFPSFANPWGGRVAGSSIFDPRCDNFQTIASHHMWSGRWQTRWKLYFQHHCGLPRRTSVRFLGTWWGFTCRNVFRSWGFRRLHFLHGHPARFTRESSSFYWILSV